MRQYNLKSFVKVYKYVLFDAVSIVVSYFLSIWLFSFAGIVHNYEGIHIALLIIVPSKLIIYGLIGIYRILTKHTGFEDIIKIASAALITNILIVTYIFVTQATFMFESAFVFITLIEVTGLIFPRVLRRVYRLFVYQMRWMKTIGIRTLIIGAGSAGELVVKEIYKNKDLNNIPTVFVDDDNDKMGKN